MSVPHDDLPCPTHSPLFAGLPQALQARQATRAGGPKTLRGKQASRKNATTHGLRCQVLVPPDDLPKIQARTAAWIADLKPEGQAQTWLVSRAAALSVRLDRSQERERIALVENTAAVEHSWFKKRRAWARRLGNRLIEQPVQAFARLLTSALGIDWLIARWEELASDLEDEMGYWCQEERERAVRLLGLSLRDTAADDPRLRPLWVHALALDDEVTVEELDWTFGRDTSHLGGAERLAEDRTSLPEEAAAKRNLLAIVRKEQQALRTLRAEVWESVDRPALESACERARTFDPGAEATLARRYETANASELSRCLNLLSRLKREARQIGDDAPSASPWSLGEPASNASAFEPFEASQAPNELHNGQCCHASEGNLTTCETASEAPRASQARPEVVPQASAMHPEGVIRPSRAQRRRALKEARRRRR